ncbi:molybdopterin-dependent oxidoreductase [Streptomyces sp. NPDC006649]|uniref:molybdopterin-dependent oxidoreductase n=1 Tax=Streptomyces sp. NPDC006649 TaxID=3156896 RepID=UPI0033AE1AB9
MMAVTGSGDGGPARGDGGTDGERAPRSVPPATGATPWRPEPEPDPRRAGRLLGRARVLAGTAPPGPFRPAFWRSPIRGPWLTAVLGLVLLFGITVVFVTGLLSYAAYNPGLGALNDKTPGKGLLGFYLFTWPTHPYWLYRLTQGVHVTLGIVLIPVVLAKLWSVVPKLFTWPPALSPAHALERLSLILLVGGVLFELATGVLNIQLDYVFPGSFYTLHFYGAWVFMAAFAAHAVLRLGRMWRAVRSRTLRSVLATDAAHTAPEPPDPYGLVAPAPASPTMSRRGALGLVGAGSLALLVVTAGQSIGGSLRRTALLAPHDRDPRPGPNGFQINKSAAAVGIRASDIGPGWRLEIHGVQKLIFTHAQLLTMDQHTARLPIACVEGWSTDDQHWSGLRLADLAALAGMPHATSVLVESVQRTGAFRRVLLAGNQISNPLSLLALHVNGAPLSPDHGHPARVIVPANPGVNNTKWVRRLTFRT